MCGIKSKVRYYRQKTGITQKKLGKMVRVTRQTINSLKNGKYNPSLTLAYRITIILGFKNIHQVFRFKKENLED